MIQTKDFNYRGAAFLGRQFINPPFDRLDNKPYLSNPYSFATYLNKSSKYDSLNNSHIITTTKEKRIPPLRSGYIETETPRDAAANLSDRKSARLKTDESEKLHNLTDLSYESPYIQKQKNSTDNRKKFPLMHSNTRALSNNRTGRYNVITRDQPSPIKSTGESIVDPKGRNMHQYLKSKRTSAHVGKNLSYSYQDANLPVIYAQGGTRIAREKVASTRVSSINSEMTEFQSLDNPNIAPIKIPKKSELSRYGQPVGKGALDNLKAFKFRMKPTEQLMAQKYTTDIAEACYLSTNPRNSESFMGEYILSPARDNSKESHEHTPQVLRKKDMNLLEAVSSSLTSKKRREDSASIDHGFEKVNELTNKNNIARYDLLRIQESALDLKMMLHGRRNNSHKPNKDNNKVHHSFVDDLNCDSMFRVDSEI